MTETFGEYLRRLRESRGLTLRQAAEAAGVSSGYLSQVEGGKRGKRKGGDHFAPHPLILKKLAHVYHVPPQQIYERGGFFDKQEEYGGFSEEVETDRCFEYVLHDPVLKQVLTLLDKRAIIDRYEGLTGRKLITWAGDYSAMYEKPKYTGLRIFEGKLYAETTQLTLTLEETSRDLGISLSDVKILVEKGHLKPSRGEGELIPKKAVRDFKEGLLRHGLDQLLRSVKEHDLKMRRAKFLDEVIKRGYKTQELRNSAGEKKTS